MPNFIGLKWDHKAVNGQMPTVSGLDNLRQRLILRFMARRGSYAWNPSYGGDLVSFQNEPLDLQTQKAMFNNIRDQALLDSGVKSVRSVTIDIDDDKPSMSFIRVKIIPIGGEEFELAFQPFHLEDS
jgi:hypothetical protein